MAAIEEVPLDTVYLDAAAQEKCGWPRGRGEGYLGELGRGTRACAALCGDARRRPVLTSSCTPAVHASSPPPAVAELLRLKGIRHVVFWAEDPTALVAAHFAGAFFGSLALPRVSVVEAYTMALHAVQVRGPQRGSGGGGGRRQRGAAAAAVSARAAESPRRAAHPLTRVAPSARRPSAAPSSRARAWRCPACQTC
jgi:hypothetical protein